MADVKISQLPAATTPLGGTEQIPLVQGTTTKKVTVTGLFTQANLGIPSAVDLTHATNVPVDQATGTLAVAHGGTGTTTPSIVAGTNVTVSGTWPNQTINSTFSGAVTSVTGTAPVASSGGATPNISMAAATTSVSGYLTSTDWTTFNNKLATNGSAASLTGLPLTTGVTGTLPIANGGTNATTATAARSNILPSYTGNGGKVLAVNAGASDTEWIAASGAGTVTSVAVSGGTTGLTTSGGPITGAGTITLAGTLAVASGGTGTATPSIVAGTNVTVSGTWPNQTINASSSSQVYPGAGIANSTGTAWGTSYTTSGTGTVVALATGAALTNPSANQINDTNTNQILGLSPTTSAVDYLVVKNGIGVGVPLHVYADGASANTGLHIQPKGSGLVTISDGTDFNKGIRFRSSSSAASAITLLDAVSTAGRVVTLPDATTTLVGRDTTDTLTNKTINLTSNTLVATSAQMAAAVSDETGSGSLVFATSPTLVTPVLGTPTSGNFSTGTFTWPTFNQNTTGTATNVTGTVAIANGGTGQTTAAAAITALTGTQTNAYYLRSNGTNATLSGLSAADLTGTVAVANGGTGINSLGTGVATWLGTPSSANLISAVTDETGSGLLVFGTTPTLGTPVVNGYTEGVVTANTSTAYTISIASAGVQILTLTGNCTYTFPTATAGKSFMLLQLQDATGSRTVTWPSSVKWPSGTAPTITSTASKGDKFVFTADGTYWWGSVAGQNYL